MVDSDIVKMYDTPNRLSEYMHLLYNTCVSQVYYIQIQFSYLTGTCPDRSVQFSILVDVLHIVFCVQRVWELYELGVLIGYWLTSFK